MDDPIAILRDCIDNGGYNLSIQKGRMVLEYETIKILSKLLTPDNLTPMIKRDLALFYYSLYYREKRDTDEHCSQIEDPKVKPLIYIYLYERGRDIENLHKGIDLNDVACAYELFRVCAIWYEPAMGHKNIIMLFKACQLGLADCFAFDLLKRILKQFDKSEEFTYQDILKHAADLADYQSLYATLINYLIRRYEKFANYIIYYKYLDCTNLKYLNKSLIALDQYKDKLENIQVKVKCLQCKSESICYSMSCGHYLCNICYLKQKCPLCDE